MITFYTRFISILALTLFTLILNATPNAELTRTITFKNFCTEKIWVAITPSYIPGNNKACSSDSDCLRGASCLGAQCVYPISLPEGGSDDNAWSLAAFNPDNPDDPATKSTMHVTLQYSVPDPANPANAVYQYVANFGARTGCQSIIDGDGKSQLICQTGQCTTDQNGTCVSGMRNPSTHAEITLNQSNVDFYDMSFVNGVNVPIGISPDNDPAPVDPYGQNPLFWCGKSGFKDARGDYYTSLSDATNLIGCQWIFQPPSTPVYQGYASSVFYTLVTYTGNVQCHSDAECNALERCGFSPDDMDNNQQAVPLCGTPVAYTVPANVCGSPYNQGAILAKQAFGCYSKPGDLAAFKMQAYAMCALPPNAPPGITAPPTCYVGATKIPDPECCGCINWQSKLPLGSNETCRVGYAIGADANFWQINIRDKVSWLADNCLAGYAYQYDDVHSTFVCSSVVQPTADNPNQLNYTVTFCPDGQRLFGLPDQNQTFFLQLFNTQ